MKFLSRRFLTLALGASAGGAIAYGAACPTDGIITEWLAVTTCTSSIGTISNFRFLGTSTNGGLVPSTANVNGVYAGLGGQSAFQLVFSVPGSNGIGGTTATSTVNFAFTLTPIAAYNNVAITPNWGDDNGGDPGSIQGAVLVCLNGTFTSLPGSCSSGSSPGVSTPVYPIPALPASPTSVTFTAPTSMDVFVTETGTGTGVAQLYPNIVFSIVAVTPPAPPATPAPPSLLLAIAGIGMAIAYLSWRKVARVS